MINLAFTVARLALVAAFGYSTYKLGWLHGENDGAFAANEIHRQHYIKMLSDMRAKAVALSAELKQDLENMINDHNREEKDHPVHETSEYVELSASLERNETHIASLDERIAELKNLG